MQSKQWIDICDLEDIVPDSGVCALVGEAQVAIFRLANGEIFAVDNHDPFSGANVISRGIVGEKNGTPKVASPVYKQNFCLKTGACLDDPAVQIPTYDVRSQSGRIQVQTGAS